MQEAGYAVTGCTLKLYDGPALDREEGTYTACELEKNGKVDWGQWGPLSGLVDAEDFTTVFRRWR